MTQDRTPGQSQMIGRRYLERGNPVTCLVRWGPGGGPRNVLIRRADGSLVVRPFRGLRKSRPVNDYQHVLDRQEPDVPATA